METKSIFLTKNKIAVVDAIDFDFLIKFNWRYSNGKALRWSVKGEHESYKRRHCILMHREILKRSGITDFKFVDHINHNELDNRRCNLRPADHSLNAANTRLNKRNTSGVKGVYWNKKNNKWVARIMFCGKAINIGSFIDIKLASKMYDIYSQKYFGEYCFNNIKIQNGK